MIALPVLVYHRVCTESEWFPSSYVVGVKSFRQQMEYLARHNWQSASEADFINPNGTPGASRRKVLITFDDGYEDTYTNAFPLLKEFGFTSLVFLVGDMQRRTNWWDVPMGVPEAPLLTRDQIAEMAEAGIQFGSHTMTHRPLPGLLKDQLDDELRGSKEAIETVTRKPVTAFSYPYSHVDALSKQAVRDAGYASAFAVNSGPLRSRTDLWEIRRVNVTSAALGPRFGVKLSGAEKCLLWTWWLGKGMLTRGNRFEIRKGF